MRSINAIPEHIDIILSKYGELFPKLNTDLFDTYENKVLYFLEDLDDHLKEEIISKLEPRDDNSYKNNIVDIFLEKIKEVYPERLEGHDYFRGRIKKSKGVYRSISKE